MYLRGAGLGLDLADDADETAAVAAKIVAARQLAAQAPELAEISPEIREHAVARREEAARTADNGGWAMLAAHGDTMARDA